MEPTPTDAPLKAALDRLLAAGTLSAEQVAAVLQEYTAATTSRSAPAGTTQPDRGHERAWTTVLAEVGGYVGVAFVFGALAVITGPHWDALSAPTRVILLLLPALLLLAAAAWIVLAAGSRQPTRSVADFARLARGTALDGPRRRLVASVVLVAGGFLAGVGGQLNVDSHTVLAAALALLTWGMGYLLGRQVLLQLATAVGAAWLILAAGNAAQQRLDLPGLGLVLLGVAWAVLAARELLADPDSGLATGGALAFLGAEFAIAGTPTLKTIGYLALAAVAVGGLVGYVRIRRVVALIIGTIALATVIPQLVLDVTDGTLGTGGALLLIGLTIVGASAIGLRLHREVPESAALGQ